MEQITIPQFIENEDRILGPLTVRQFIIILVAAGLLFVAFKTTDLTAFIFSATIIGGTAGLLAFYRVNGQPFHFFLLNLVRTASRPTLRVWKKQARHFSGHVKETVEEKKQEQAMTPSRQTPSGKRLSELSLIVDTGGAYRGEKEAGTELF